MSKRRPLNRLFLKGPKRGYQLQAAEKKGRADGAEAAGRYVSIKAEEQGVQVPGRGSKARRTSKDDQRRTSKDDQQKPVNHLASQRRKVSSRNGLPPLSTGPATASSLQQEVQLQPKKRDLLPKGDAETASIDSVSRILAECTDSQGEDELLPSPPRRGTTDLDSEIQRLLNGGESSESDVDVAEGTNHGDHTHSSWSADVKGGGSKEKPDVLYILYGPDGKEELPGSSRPSTSSDDGSPGIPHHPIAIRSGTLDVGSEIFIDLGSCERRGQGELVSTSSSTSVDEEDEADTRRVDLPKTLAQELEEAQRPPSASRVNQRRQGVCPPSMEEMRILLESLADTESNFSSVTSSGSSTEQLARVAEQRKASSGSETSQQDRTAAQLPPAKNSSQKEPQMQPLTFDMLAMTRSEVSLSGSDNGDEEAGFVIRDTSRNGVTQKLETNPTPVPTATITLDMLATDSGSDLSIVSTESEGNSQKFGRVRRTESQSEAREEHKVEEDMVTQQRAPQSEWPNLKLASHKSNSTGWLPAVTGGEKKFSGGQVGKEDKWKSVNLDLKSTEHLQAEVSPRRDLTRKNLGSQDGEREVQRLIGKTEQQLEETDSAHPQLSSRVHRTTDSDPPDVHTRSDTSLNTSNQLPLFRHRRPEEKEDVGREPRTGATEGMAMRARETPPEHPTPTPEFAKVSTGPSRSLPQKPVTAHHGATAPTPEQSDAQLALTVPQKLRPPQSFSGLTRDHTKPQVPARPPRSKAPTEKHATDDPLPSNPPSSNPQQVPVSIPRPVPKPRKKISNPSTSRSASTVPTASDRPGRAEGATSTRDQMVEGQAVMESEQSQAEPIRVETSRHLLLQETPQAADGDLIPIVHSLFEKIAQMEERQRLMMETFETEREALWSMISKQAQIIQRMNRAGVDNRRRTKRRHQKLQQRLEAVEMGVLAVGRECAGLDSRLVATETAQRSIMEVLSKRKATVAEGGAPSQASSDISPRQRQRKISLLSEHKVTKLKKFFGDNPPLLELFLKRLGYEQYLPRFLSERIGLLELPHVSEDQLISLGIPMGPRLRIMNEAQLL